MSEPSPLRSVTIAADRWVRTPLALLCTAVGVVFLTGWWASSVWRDIQDVKSEQARQAKLQEVQGEDIALIKSWLNPNGSRPVISKADQ